MCDRGVQMLITTVGAFAAFSLMTIAVGTDYWLYSRGVCRTKSANDNETSRKNEEVMTHSGLWRTCCLEGTFRGVCKKIDHFPEDADYEQDAAEYLLQVEHDAALKPNISKHCTYWAVRPKYRWSHGYGFKFTHRLLSRLTAAVNLVGAPPPSMLSPPRPVTAARPLCRVCALVHHAGRSF
ncbi:voltage-dependent calcium channel gamma-3 subunit isoform X1 [Arapaima gigas]